MANIITAVTAEPLLPLADTEDAAAGELDKQLEKASRQQPDPLLPTGWCPPLPVPLPEPLPLALSLPHSRSEADNTPTFSAVIPVSGRTPAPSLHQPPPPPSASVLPVDQPRSASAVTSAPPLPPLISQLPPPPPLVSQQPVAGERPPAPAVSAAELSAATPAGDELSVALKVEKPRPEDHRGTPIPTPLPARDGHPSLNREFPPPSADRQRVRQIIPAQAQPVTKPVTDGNGQNRISYAFTSWGSEHRVQLTAVRDGNQQLTVMMNPSDPLVSRRLQEAMINNAPIMGAILAEERASDQQQQRRDKQPPANGEDEE
ncbi:hypothetical protein [Pantoea sp. B65]|uniref:SpaN/EivJ family type III secretion system needle length determinant n=1 Tax=Pantoea sp. B65 TaxID=2813359 RepID=UPI0039B5DBCD